MYHVIRQRQVPVPREQVWSALCEPERLGQWFAETDRLEVGERFCFSFGDGDFFAGTLHEAVAPDHLFLSWKFMDIGPRFEVRYFLTPLADGGSEVTVHDHGSLSVEEVMSLRQGWDDFLMRLDQFVRTGRNVRYTWSESIGIGALLASTPCGALPAELDDPAWWRRHFLSAQVVRERTGERSLLVRFTESDWDGAATEALVESAAVEGGTYLGLTHRGWPALPAMRQIVERRRYAGLWLGALKALEERYG
jgi:uncharacterized protein YndB with AHSA1/START domain